MDIKIKPIGYVKSDITESTFQQNIDVDVEERKRQNQLKYKQIKQIISELIIDPSYADMLDGVEKFSHIDVIYWPHLLSDKQRKLRKVHPMGRKDLPLQGIFATRSPARPNSILISTVELLKRQNNILQVRGLEALDGSPILDIKTYIQISDQVTNPVFPEWVHQIKRELQDETDK
jgi:tRNA-Thr(GGU) m(6)t(6)A37 methyltransferase TsaA